MAAEEIFTASAVTTIGTLGIFAMFYLRSKGWLWQHVWTAAILLTLINAYTVEVYGWQHAAVANELADLSFGVVHALMWMMILLFGYMLLSLFYQAIRSAQDMLSGRRKYGKPDEENPY